mmetsp:Transcript_21534/g.33693  ORF Transcript_21534/g.33693 Transcript_21534/m.33693 type:complete len:87 (+) Transcript_21534:23-283(+)
MLFKILNGSMLAVDPNYEAYVAAAGIDGNTDFDIVGNYCCAEAKQPCSTWTFPSAAYAPAPLGFSTAPAATVAGPAADATSIYNTF